MRARWSVVLVVAMACSSSNPSGGGSGSGVTGVSVTAPAKVTSGLRISLQATVQGTTSNRDVTWTVVGGGRLTDTGTNPATYFAPMVTAVTTVQVKATSVVDGTRSATVSIEVDPAPPLVARVDPGVVPVQPSLPDRQGNPLPVANSKDAAGIQSEFIVGQVVLRPRSSSDLSTFLQRYDGTVVSDDTVPEPPATLGLTLTAAQRQASEYLVRINLAKVDPSTFVADAAALGLYGAMDYSSQDALLSMAAITNAAASGFDATPNFVTHPSGFPRTLLVTQERPSGATFEDALTKTTRFGTTGSVSNVTLAWQFVAAHGIARKVFVAIIDGGFWLNTDGTARGTDFDWPASPLQYDFVSDDYLADGPNPNNCSAGSSCFWHGTGSAGTSTGALDNKQGAAGTGGLVADPMLFKFTGARDQRNRAVRTAVAWGADVVSMSFGGDCNQNCRIYDRAVTPFSDAIGGGSKIVFVASAGNGDSAGNGYDVGDPHFVHPCIEDHVICIGALNDDAITRIGYSNFGGQVQIFAPTNIQVQSAPARNDNNPAGPASGSSFGGTSASAPFVAGVVAMMKAVNPDLDNDTVATILRDTAHLGVSPVDRYIDAYAAVRRAAQGTTAVADRFEPDNSPGTAAGVGAGNIGSLSFQTDTDHDFFRIDLAVPSRVTLNFSYAQALGPLAVGGGYGLQAQTVGCGEFAEESSTPGMNAQTLVYRVPAGSYLVEVSGKLNAYDWSWSSAPLGQILYSGDRYEPNDTFSRAVDLGFGKSGTATLTPGDVDVYRFSSQGTISNAFLRAEGGFHVNRTNVPVTVALFSSTGAPIGVPVNGATNCEGNAGFGPLPAGTYYAKVSAQSPGGQGSYEFFGGVAAIGGSGPTRDRVYERLHPGDPVEAWITDRYKGYIFTHGPEVSQLGLLAKSRLQLQILDLAGNVLADGFEPPIDAQLGFFQQIAMAQFTVGTDYLIQISRVSAELDTAPVAVPPVSFTMGWSQGSPRRDSGNLILNGDADDGNQGATDTGAVVDLRFWQRSPGSALTAVYYNSLNFPSLADPGPPQKGHAFFAGGPAVGVSGADQTVDLSGNYASWFPVIDAGNATFKLSGWLGGFLDQDDGTTLEARFLDANGQELGQAMIGPVSSAERDGLTGTFLRQTSDNVPSGTRKIAVHLEMTRAGGAYNDGTADSLSLSLQDWSP